MSPSAGEKQLCYVKPPCGILHVAYIHYTAALLSFITIHYVYQPALTLSVSPLEACVKDRPLSFAFVFLLRFIFPIGLSEYKLGGYGVMTWKGFIIIIVCLFVFKETNIRYYSNLGLINCEN